MGKGDKKHRRRERRRAAQARSAMVSQHRAGGAPQSVPDATQEAVRPTPQRMARGSWHIPRGMGKHSQPVTDAQSDIVGQLYEAGRITTGQEQAARHWQQVRARYVAELPDVATFKSCIAGSVPGYDDGDGDPQVIEEYRQIERRLTIAQRREVLLVCEDGYRPRDIQVLRAALDVVGGK